MTVLSAEGGGSSQSSVEKGKLIVMQPQKLQELSNLLETLAVLPMRISERAGEDISGDLGGSGSSAGTQTGGTYVSPRDQAIASIPAQAVMRKDLAEHIEKEVKHLERLASSMRRTSLPGVAYRLNELYGRIRRLNALLLEILEASYDVMKRLFVRVFIDKLSVI